MRVEQITFTRFLAALPIIVFHFGRETSLFKSETIGFLSQCGYLGVSYFFVLSGFVMMLAYGERSEIKNSEYWTKRAARIYPAYATAMILLYIYMLQHSDTMKPNGILLNIFVIQAYVPGHALDFNFPGWSISVEFFFYLLFPFLFNLAYLKLSFKKLAVVIVLIWVVTQVASILLGFSKYYHGFPSKSHDLLCYFPPVHLSEFLVGNLAGLYFIKNLKEKKANYDLHILGFCVLLAVCFYFSTKFNMHNGFLAFLYIPILILLAMNTGIISRVFRSKILVFLGEISYGVYIFQLPVFYFLSGWFSGWNIVDPDVSFYLYLLGLILISVLSYWLVESPVRKWVNGFLAIKKK